MVKIHLRGQPAVGDLKRPFKVAGMFGTSTGPITEKAAIEAAEKKRPASGAGGSKKDL